MSDPFEVFKKFTQALVGEVLVVDDNFMAELYLQLEIEIDAAKALTHTCSKFGLKYDDKLQRFVRI